MPGNRRNFLRTIGGGGIAATLFPSATTTAEAQATAGIPQRAYATGKFALQLDNAMCGWLSSADGGYATGEVVTAVGPEHLARKHLANIRYEPLTLSCGAAMSKAVYDWIKSTFDKHPVSRNGAIISADYNLKEISRLNWKAGAISEVSFPVLDAGSKEQAALTVKIIPTNTWMTKGTGTPVPGSYAKVQPMWLSSMFRLVIQGCEAASQRISRVESLSLKWKATGNEPAYLDFSNLVVSVPEAFATEFYQWYEDFIVKGNRDAAHERTATLYYLSPNTNSALFTLRLKGLGIFRLSSDKAESASAIRRLKVEMYCQDMAFTYTGGPNLA